MAVVHASSGHQVFTWPRSAPSYLFTNQFSTCQVSPMASSTKSRSPQSELYLASDHDEQKRDGSSSESDDSYRTSPATKTDRKRPRYLSDIDRSIIIQRLDKGEKQADLAREFGVTRAAICHINKNKHEVLTRFDIFARSPQGRVLIENYSRPSTEFANVIEVRTASASVLTTRLKDRFTTPVVFRASADRLIRLLLEEALVSYGSARMTSNSFSSQGVELLTLESSPCAVALGDKGEQMLKIFQEMEPGVETGSITAAHAQLPPRLDTSSILLLVPVVTSATAICAAIEELERRGVEPSFICVVCVFCSIDAIREVTQHNPEVNIITAVVDRQPSDGAAGSLLDFVLRYDASHAGDAPSS